MLANGRTRPTLFTNNRRGILPSSEKLTNTTLQFPQRSQSIAPISELQENGLEPEKSDHRNIVNELEDFTENSKVQTLAINNNKANTWPVKMAAANTSGPSQQLANTNGYPLPMVSNSGLPGKSGSTGMELSTSVHNNQLATVMDANAQPSNINPTSGSMNMGAGGEASSTVPSSSQYNVFNSRQDNFLPVSSRSTSRDIPGNPMMHGAPIVDQQYGSLQQRSFLSGPNDSQIRALNRQSLSPYPSNFFPKESHNNQTQSRVENSQPNEKVYSSNEHVQWPQRVQRYPNSSKPLPTPSMSRNQMQSGMPSRQPPFMMVGQHLPPQPTQSPQHYMMHSQMKSNTMSNQVPSQYYGMGSLMQRQQGIQPNQIQKNLQDYGSFPQQPYSHYSQPPGQYPSSMPPYMQSRQQQQPMSQSPSNMSRMVQSPQAILPKPSLDMYSANMGPARYSNNMTDSPMDYQGPPMNEHVPQQAQHRAPQQQSFPSPSGIGPPSEGPTMPVNQRGYYPGYPSSPSPNVTLGSPLRNLQEGFPPNSAMPGPTLPGGSVTPTFPNTPPSSGMPPMYPLPNTSSHSGAAAAAAAVVMQAANSKYPPLMAHQEQSPRGYEGITASRGQMGVVPTAPSGTSAMPSTVLPGVENSSAGNNIETGQVPSPTLNMLPTAEDVEAMIKSMSSEDARSMDGSRTPQNCPPPSTSTSKHSDLPGSVSESLGGTTASPAQNMNQPNNSASPLSSFSEQFSPGVSISSFGGDDDNDGFSVPVDDITPTLGQSSNSLLTKQSKDSPQFVKYSQLYEVSEEPERKEFLDKYSSFMDSTGNPVRQIPVFNNQILDIFKLYKVIKENGGLQEVVKRKLWDKVLMSLNISPEQTVLSSQLRNHYSRFLLAYEMADVTKSSHTTPVENLFDDAAMAPPNATVTCSEVIFPAPTKSASNQSGGTYPTGYGQATSNGPYWGYGSYGNHQRGDSHVEAPYDSSSSGKGYQPGMESRSPMATPQPSNSTYNLPPYPYGSDRSSHPNYRGYSQHSPAPQHLPSTPPMSQLQHRNSNLPGYHQHPLPQGPQPMLPQQRPQQDAMYPMWSQYKASTEPEHIFDYPPNGQPTSRQPLYPSSRQQQAYPNTPHQYRHSPPPQGARSPSLSRQPMTPTHQTPSQLSKPKGNLTKKEFPLESVEATKPLFTKKRKLTSRDLGPVEAWRVMMSLKSGLLSETTWALDALNILLYDDHTVGYFLLSHLPGLLDNLLDHFRRYLLEIFGAFWENDEEEEKKDCGKASGDVKVKEEKSENDEQLGNNVCRSLTAFLAATALPGDGNHGDEWWLSSIQSSRHIQTHLGTDVTPKRRKHDDVHSIVEKPKETNCKLKRSGSTLYDTAKWKPEIKSEVGSVKVENKVEKDCDGKHCKKGENCVTSFHGNDWGLESEDSSSDADETSAKNSTTTKNDSRVLSQEEFTAKLKQELDLDIDSTLDESDSNAYIQSIISTRVEHSKKCAVVEEESLRTEESTLSLRTEADDALSRRCVCVSNILRGLSFVPGNDVEMFRNSGLLLILGKLLLLYHKHAKRVPYRHSFMQEDVEVDAPCDDCHDWWWQSLEVLRENALVILSNIAGQLDLSVYPKAISTPILDGLLHWFACQSAEAIDPMPTATVGTSLSARQLVLETLAKMSILGGNTELILSASTPRLEALYATLVRLLGQRENPVSRELSLVVLSNLSQSDNEYACLVEKKQCIAMLLQFIEDAAASINAYSSGGSLAQAGFNSEDFCGTSVDMLRRAASSLVCLSRCKPIRSLFLPYQERLLLLTTLKLLERMIGAQLADVLYYLSR